MGTHAEVRASAPSAERKYGNFTVLVVGCDA